MERVSRNIFKLKLPALALELNSYLMIKDDRLILIDTGTGSRAFSSLEEQLNELGLRISDITDVVVTHLHIDHIGLAHTIRRISGAKILMHAEDKSIVESIKFNPASFTEKLIHRCMACGAPEELTDVIRRFHPAVLGLSSYTLLEVDGTLDDGSAVSAEGPLLAIWTPGHTPGHICLYDERERVLFSGDHILLHVTPNIAPFYEDHDPLAEYLNSLSKVEGYNAVIVLPAHGPAFSGLKGRIKELKEHHKRRLSEVLEKLSERPMTAYELASQLTWNIDYPSWEDFPFIHKFFAMGETLAHLAFLARRGLIKVEASGIVNRFVHA